MHHMELFFGKHIPHDHRPIDLRLFERSSRNRTQPEMILIYRTTIETRMPTVMRTRCKFIQIYFSRSIDKKLHSQDTYVSSFRISFRMFYDFLSLSQYRTLHIFRNRCWIDRISENPFFVYIVHRSEEFDIPMDIYRTDH